MTKQEVKRALQKASEVQAFMTATQFARVMGMKSPDYAEKRFLTGLECLDNKYYFISDIAERIMADKKLKYGEDEE